MILVSWGMTMEDDLDMMEDDLLDMKEDDLNMSGRP